MNARWLPNSQTLTIHDDSALEACRSHFDPPPSLDTALTKSNELVWYQLESVFKPPSMPLVPARVKRISCAACGHCLAVGDWRVTLQPPSYWMDLVDAWSCHRQEFAPLAHRYQQAPLPEDEIQVGSDSIRLQKLPSSECSVCLAKLADGMTVPKWSVCLDERAWSMREVLREMLLDLIDSRHCFEVQLIAGQPDRSWLLKILNWDGWVLFKGRACFERCITLQALKLDDPCATRETLTVGPELASLIPAEGLVVL